MILRGARIPTADGGFAPQDLTIRDGRIAALDAETGAGDGPVWDASGLLLLPGIVDLHGDAFERQLMPRPQVHFPLDVALLDTDRQLIANGITTALHGLTWSWEPGLRGEAAAARFIDGLAALKPRLSCDSHVHLRHETYNIDAAPQIEAWMAAGRIRLLAFNNHLPMFERRIDAPTKLAQYAERAHLSLDDFIALVRRVADRGPEVAATNRRLADSARRHGVILASHDDESPAMRRDFHEMGCTICEFPLNRPTAQEGRRLGSAVIMGAPNVLRGGSHLEGGMAAAELAAEGLVDVLTSDYYYPALLHAPFVLAQSGRMSLAAAWRLVSVQPARAGGFDDRGEIAVGQRADLLLIDDRVAGSPHLVACFVAGAPVFSGRRPA